MKQLLLIACLSLAAGCGQPIASPNSAAAPADSAFPVIITDDLGNSVTIPKRPMRIVSLAPAITETLFAIGAGPRVVAVTTADTYPPEVKQLPAVGAFSSATISTEAILAQRPDLVIAAGKFHQATVETLSKLGVKVLAVDANTLEEVEKIIELIGQATGQHAEASTLLADFRRRHLAVHQRNLPTEGRLRPKVLYVLWDEPLMTAGPTSFIGQMIDEAGGRNIFADSTQLGPRVSDEAVLERNPELIIVPTHGDTSMSDRIRKRTGWNQLTAVTAGRIESIDGDLVNRPGPRVIDGLEAIEALIRKGLQK